MANKKSVFIKTHPAILAVWAALIAVASLLPSIPVIGTGATFSISDVMIPLAGVLFGQWAGGIAAGIGGLIGQLIAPHTVIFGPFQFVLAMLGAAGAGFAMQRKWIIPIVTIAFFGIVWYFSPLGQSAWFTPIGYLVGILGALIGWFWGGKWVSSSNRTLMFVGVFLTTLAGMVCSWSAGNFWALLMFALPKEVWAAVLVIAPVQRILFALGAAIIGTPLLVGLPKISVPVGQMIYEKDDEED
ncbi:MAG: ECF transporter S component [Anaerolineales bacterium]|nr:ECF transporter S component [Anaerolineales bacterium]